MSTHASTRAAEQAPCEDPVCSVLGKLNLLTPATGKQDNNEARALLVRLEHTPGDKAKETCTPLDALLCALSFALSACTLHAPACPCPHLHCLVLLPCQANSCNPSPRRSSGGPGLAHSQPRQTQRTR
eukprot:1151165-Pelagomonas_calceolata.AAC.2